MNIIKAQNFYMKTLDNSELEKNMTKQQMTFFVNAYFIVLF